MALSKYKHIAFFLMIVGMTTLICQNYVYNYLKSKNIYSCINNINDIEEDAHKIEVKDFVIKYVKNNKIELSSIADNKISNAHLTDDAIKNQNFVLFIGEPPEYLV